MRFVPKKYVFSDGGDDFAEAIQKFQSTEHQSAGSPHPDEIYKVSYRDFLIVTNIVFIIDLMLISFFLWKYGYNRLDYR